MHLEAVREKLWISQTVKVKEKLKINNYQNYK